MNIIAFVPVGFLAGYAIKKMTLKKVIFVGLCISISIETMQLLFHRGLSEVDDVIHNTIGCIIGYGIYHLTRRVYELFSNSPMTV